MPLQPYFDRDASERREADIWGRLDEIERRVGVIERPTEPDSGTITPAINNFVLNGDGNYTQGGMVSASTFANKEHVAAHWYTLPSSGSTQLIEHTTSTESSHALMNSTHPSYSDPACAWDKSAGVFKLGGGSSLIHPLTKNLALPGLRLFVQAKMKLDTGVSITSTHQIQAAIMENLGSGSRRIVEASGFNLGLDAVGGTGATTRQYVVEIITTNGTSRSNATSITNSVATLSATQFVSISWHQHLGVISIHIYRSEDGGATWKKITGTGLTGGTSYFDTGAAGVTASLPSAANQKAFARVIVSDALTSNWQLVTFSIPIPPYYTMLVAPDKQMLEISVVDSSGSPVSTTNRGILVDKVGVSYNNGIWTPSPEDLITGATVQSTNPDPGQGPGGGFGDPEDGGGTCVLLDQPVLMADGSTKPAGQVEVGDKIKALNFETRKLEDTEVTKVRHGTTHNVLSVTTTHSTLQNNPPHRILTPTNGLGQAAVSFTLASKVLVAGYIDGNEVVFEDSVTGLYMSTTEAPTPVVTFHVSHPSRNYIAGHLDNGIGGPVSHNRKPLEFN